MTPDGHVHVRFAGIPGYTYDMLRAQAVNGPWAKIGSFLVPDDGLAEFEDSNPPAGMALYRTSAP